uniref:Uncharacterized protein n=1 Tax=Rhizophora mucronata TaxID=61149 RepID=A0A2P2KUS1_RHIMU
MLNYFPLHFQALFLSKG